MPTAPTLTDGVVTLRAAPARGRPGLVGAVPGPAVPAVDDGPGALLDGRRPHVRRRDHAARLGRRHRVGLRGRGRRPVRRHRLAAPRGRRPGRARLRLAPVGPRHRPRGAGAAAAARLGLRRAGARTPSSGGPTRATGPRAGSPGGSGFTIEGTLRSWLPQRGELRDAWVGTLLRDDPREPRTPWLDVPRPRGRRRPAAAAGDADVAPRSSRPAATSGRQYWLGRHAAARTRVPTPRPTSRTGPRCWPPRARSAGRWPTRPPTTVLGSVACSTCMLGREAELGYWTHPDARGRGVMTAAAPAGPAATASGALGLAGSSAFAAVREHARRGT